MNLGRYIKIQITAYPFCLFFFFFYLDRNIWVFSLQHINSKVYVAGVLYCGPWPRIVDSYVSAAPP